MIQPPRVGPSVGPMNTPTPKRAEAKPRCSRVKVSKRMAWEVESRAPPPMPWMKRKATSCQMLWAWPQAIEATVKRRIELT